MKFSILDNDLTKYSKKLTLEVDGGNVRKYAFPAVSKYENRSLSTGNGLPIPNLFI
jgi:hypothetical protein